MTRLEACRARETEEPALAEQEAALQRRMQAEARERIAALRAARRRSAPEEDDFDDDDYDVEVEYRP